MTNEQRFNVTLQEIKAVRGLKESQGMVKMLDAMFKSDPNSIIGRPDFFKIASGLEKKWIADNAFVVVKKKDATCLLTVGERSQSGAFIIGKHKNYWLAPQI